MRAILPLMNEDRKQLAIQLRKQGKSYQSILSKVPVAKSTLSQWFRSAGLSSPQKQQMTALRKAAALKGARSRKEKRLAEVSQLNSTGLEEVGQLSKRELWLIGTALYWAEGSKQNTRSLSTGVIFGNSDPRMLKVFLRWLKDLEVDDSSLIFELYVHNTREAEKEAFKSWWVKELGLDSRKVDRIYVKPGNPSTKRSNTKDLYHGLLRIKVRSSTYLNRRINGWVEGIVH